MGSREADEGIGAQKPFATCGATAPCQVSTLIRKWDDGKGAHWLKLPPWAQLLRDPGTCHHDVHCLLNFVSFNPQPLKYSY